MTNLKKASKSFCEAFALLNKTSQDGPNIFQKDFEWEQTPEQTKEHKVPLDLETLQGLANEVGGKLAANVNALVADVKRNGLTQAAYNIYMPLITQEVVNNPKPEYAPIRGALEALTSFKGMFDEGMARGFGTVV